MGHTKLEFLHKYPFTLKQNRFLKKYRLDQLVKPLKTKIPTGQDWQKPDKIIDPSKHLWFTEGSGNI
jgi:hypothetical protein